MIIKLELPKWLRKPNYAPLPEPISSPELPAQAVETIVANKFIGVLETVGKDFLKGLSFAVSAAVPIEKLVPLLFPAAVPIAGDAGTALSLIQNAVLVVEQKYAASGVQNGTGVRKLADVLSLTEGAVTSLLGQAGITVDTSYLTNLVNAVVAILNVQTVPAA